MLTFLFWGIALNIYLYIVLFVIVKAIYPKGYKSPYDKPKPLILKIAVIFVPYLIFLFSLVAIVGLAICKFDYEEVERRRKRLKEARLYGNRH